MLQAIQSETNRLLRSIGYEISRYNGASPGFQERAALTDPEVDTVIDVGGNEGQFGRRIRKIVPSVPMVSFEPLPKAFARLQASAAREPNWTAFNVGLGRSSEVKELIVSENDQCSSFLQVAAECVDAVEQSRPVGRIEVAVDPIDKYVDHFGRSVYMKIDTQGFEMEVLSGAMLTLQRAKYVFVELSFIPLYKDAPLAHEVMAWMQNQGFEVISFIPGFSDLSRARMLQADVLFARRDMPPPQ